MSFASYANTSRFIVNLGLERVSRLLSLVGNPERKIKAVHIAGTNGKGSVCAFLQSILISSGLKVGLYSSPELCDIHERIRVNGENISETALSNLFSRLEKAAEAMDDKPSPFEIWTAAAYLHFFEQNCDISIIETGMGGLSDATNVIPAPSVSVITRISFDHTDYLGNTLSSIASHKAGIIKENRPVVTINQPDDAMKIISRTCREKSAPLRVVPVPPTELSGIYESYNGTTLSIAGLHQVENAALAAETARLLGIDENHISYGLSHATHPARLEFLSPNILFGGAHNPDGAAALSQSLTRLYGNEKFAFIYAAMRDKDIAGVLKILSKHASRFVFTTVPENPRSADEETLFQIADELNIPYSFSPTPADALSAVSNEKRVIITGSLYLYKYIKASVN
ncbi:MAG: bifunctional folylpolyglutamate synthase/dihydrofolate synthase [Clostridia bacterium]|nr:bifunctional folylpolyglutamate synthase/dihydrofolate synthase [Clostridia bacterium]